VTKDHTHGTPHAPGGTSEVPPFKAAAHGSGNSPTAAGAAGTAGSDPTNSPTGAAVLQTAPSSVVPGIATPAGSMRPPPALRAVSSAASSALLRTSGSGATGRDIVVLPVPPGTISVAGGCRERMAWWVRVHSRQVHPLFMYTPAHINAASLATQDACNRSF
jgi:hypothetical protein